ncbi:MAG: hypothetical protein KG003_10485 [Bacteroidetes bacterium]|nr:hypothetical protein [Bacteroidota bacterium]
MKPILFVTGILIISTFSCKKNSAEIKDCDKNNYGTITINFSSTVYRHSILITYPGSGNSREKIVAKGVASDTVHLAPNANNYPVNVSSIDDFGAAIEQKTEFATITKCGEVKFSFNF